MLAFLKFCRTQPKMTLKVTQDLNRKWEETSSATQNKNKIKLKAVFQQREKQMGLNQPASEWGENPNFKSSISHEAHWDLWLVSTLIITYVTSFL